mmetsp:Transcript_20749/g.51897  ORF Transcript_20749/g.51897 Transcript_20749/m.51897 type:complete len:244 (+) Transcript_20749:386-1117(+)
MTVFSSLASSPYVPASKVFKPSPVFFTTTAPLKTTPAARETSPSNVRLLQAMSDGAPSGMIVSIASTNLYLPSSLMFGGTPPRSGASTMRKSSVSVYASERSANKSFVVFTGAKRERGMTIAVAPSKQEIAAPMAVSSCRTFVDFLSRGSTVFPFFITGKGMEPPCFSKMAFSATKSTQRLLVLKNLYLVTSWKAFSSSSGHCADSRRSKPPVLLSFARWPPFLSASVRVATSIMNGAPVETK